jgi:hypothetical protein
MTNVNDAQREMLLKAAENPQGVIDAEADAKLIKSVIKKGWAMSIPLAEGGSRLTVTDAGREAIGMPRESAPAEKEGATADAPATKNAKRVRGQRKSNVEWPTGKLGMLVSLLQRPQGANLAEMVAATGWQAHSVRGAMSGGLKKSFNFVIDSRKVEDARTYRIAPDGAA